MRLGKGFKAPNATPQQIRWLQIERICRRYPGWTLEYVKSLSVLDTQRIFGLIEAENELTRIERERAKQHRPRRRR